MLGGPIFKLDQQVGVDGMKSAEYIIYGLIKLKVDDNKYLMVSIDVFLLPLHH